MSVQITQIEAAERLGLSRMQINNLVKAGMPTKTKNGSLKVLWPEAMHWYIQRKVEETIRKRAPAKSAGFEEERTRKTAAEAKLAEIELLKALGEMMTVEEGEKRILEAFQRVRAKLITAPSTYAPQILHLKTVPEALTVLDTCFTEIMAELEEPGDVPMDDQDVEDADGGDSDS